VNEPTSIQSAAASPTVTPSTQGAAAPSTGIMSGFNDIQRMAKAVVFSRLFPSIQNEAQAITLMLICQAEGLHPVEALRHYDIIQGRAAMKSEAMLARFQSRGGTVKWIKSDATEARALFCSRGCPEGFEYAYSMADATVAGLAGKDNYKKNGAAMLRARCVSGGVRATDPGAILATYTPEEVADFEPPKGKAVEQAPEGGALQPADLGTPDRNVAPPLDAEHEEVDPEVPPAVGPEGEDVSLDRLMSEAAANRAKAEAELASRPIPVPAFIPMHCNICKAPVKGYRSDSKQFPGRIYYGCEAAHDLKLEFIKEGLTAAKANAKVAGHFREWADKSTPAEVEA